MSAGLENSELVDIGRSVVDSEISALNALRERIDTAFVSACRRILATEGRVVVIGMGKSGHIGGKIASTFASTGTPAFFVHPAEASHGDLGMITEPDTVLALSNSGETPELLAILPTMKRSGIATIAMTGKSESTLAEQADVVLNTAVDHEACPHDLAPTSSALCMLAMGDALALALLSARGFTTEDFARAHPGGALGKRLVLYASDIMVTGDAIPIVLESSGLSAALVEMSSKGLGMTAVVDDQNRLVGIFTDGDLRRSLERGVDVYAVSMAEIMTRDPVSTGQSVLAVEVLKIMQDRRINGIFMVNDRNHIVGAMNNQTLLAAGII